MAKPILESRTDESATPWGGEQDKLIKHVQKIVPCQSVVAGLLHIKKPQIDEVLFSQGFDLSALRRWFQTGHTEDGLIRDTTRKGVIIRTAKDPECEPSELLTSGSAIMVAVPESIPEKRWWFMMLRRRSGKYTKAHGHAAYLLLRKWQAMFNRPSERDVYRFLIGHDDRLIGADLESVSAVRDHPTLVKDMLAEIRPPLEQRYPDLPDFALRDLAIHINGQPYWVCVRRCRVVRDEDAVHWCIEVRPLEKDELPPIGVVEDDRIAESIAFLHDRFAESPSLATIAKAMHMSPFHFHRLFSRQVGISPKHYLQHKQLSYARWMLRSTRTPIGSIAQSTGFSSHGHFTSTFHRVVGLSPTQYRESH